MAKVAKLQVELIGNTKDAQQIVAAAIRQCYSPVGSKDLKQKISREKMQKLIRQVLSSGHTSTIEHAVFTFAVEGISRACSHQLVRHRVASYSQQSQRYVDFRKSDSFSYIVPPAILANKKLLKIFQKNMDQQFAIYRLLVKAGIAPEDARFVLPNAAETKIVITMNARSLFNFLSHRMCNRAQWEIRALANKMHQELMKVAPDIFKYAGPPCQTELICWEGKLNCGKPDRNRKIQVRSHVL
ncbi:MAG: FAD-dependent thymidylate synthase [Patescibacteria group bacterium]|nr:FAD-dependent thymidylate synthase [Patescibacteria group bacterium]